MKKAEVLQRIHDIGLLPVVRAATPELAFAVVEAIQAGGVSTLEITMTVPGALGVIEKLAQRYGDTALVGAGTVLDPETARACILAGAKFIVSPALNVKTIELCRRYGVAVMPGALTPTEIVTAWQAGADVVKVFPCNALGGAKYLRDVKAPLPQIDLIPTGGVSLATAGDFIRAGALAVGVGSDLVNLKAIQNGDSATVTAQARAYLFAIAEARSSLQ